MRIQRAISALVLVFVVTSQIAFAQTYCYARVAMLDADLDGVLGPQQSFLQLSGDAVLHFNPPLLQLRSRRLVVLP
jgi:hypothetical protein